MYLFIIEWMNEWMNEWKIERMNNWIIEWMNGLGGWVPIRGSTPGTRQVQRKSRRSCYSRRLEYRVLLYAGLSAYCRSEICTSCSINSFINFNLNRYFQWKNCSTRYFSYFNEVVNAIFKVSIISLRDQ